MESKVRGDNMKLKNLIITGILLTTMIITGCDGKSETAKVTKEKSQMQMKMTIMLKTKMRKVTIRMKLLRMCLCQMK